MHTQKWLSLGAVAGVAQVGVLVACLTAADADDGAARQKPDPIAPTRRAKQQDASVRNAVDDLAQLASALRSPGEEYNRAFDAGISGGDPGTATNKFLQVLGDRRCAKSFSLLEAMPRDVAARRAIELLDESIRILNDDFVEAIGQWRLRGKSDHPFFIATEHHAVCCLFFLCGNYCEPEEVLTRLDKFNSSGIAHRAAIVVNPTLAPLHDEVERHSQTDPLFEVNLYLMMIEGKGCSTAVIKGLPVRHNVPYRSSGTGLGAGRQMSVVRSLSGLWEGAPQEIAKAARKELEDCK
jgi:hypothetical protein